MKKNKVSVIVPIYGVEKYLPECLDSIINQTYTNLEIILVDDKSPDESGRIADEYARKDERVKVIHKAKNGGLYQARITGFNAMRGDYFITIDSDDFVDKEFVAGLVNTAGEADADIVSYRGFIVAYDDESKNYPVVFSKEAIGNIGVSYPKYIRELAASPNDWHWNMWGRLFKKESFDRAKEYLANTKKHLTMAEDLLIFSILAYFAKSTTVVNDFRYYYRQNNQSAINTDSPERVRKHLADVRLVFSDLKKFIVQVDDYKEYQNDFEKLEKHIIGDHEWKMKHFTNSPDRRIALTGKQRILCPTAFGTFNGGGERSSYTLWRWLNQYYDCILALPKDTNKQFLDACEKDKISYVLCNYERTVPDNNSATVDLISVIKEYQPDVIFPALYFPAAFWAAAVTNTPCVFLDYSLLEQLLTNCSDDQQAMKHFTNLLHASNIVVVNALHGVQTSRQFGRNAVLAWSYTEPPKAKLKNIKATRLIYPARIDVGQKKQLQLLEGVKILKQNGVKVKTILIGSYEKKIPEQREYYECVVRYIKKHQLSNEVEMPGWIDNPWNEFGVNDIYVTSTVTEAVGRATLEAVELGIPILIPDIPGHREFREILKVSDEHFYTPGDMAEFAKKVEYLINHLEAAKRRAKVYQRRALVAFSEENCNKNILPAIQAIIGKGNPAFYNYSKQMFNENIAKQVHINNLEAEKSWLNSENARLNSQLASHLGVKRAAKLTLGNLKRRIKYGKNRH